MKFGREKYQRRYDHDVRKHPDRKQYGRKPVENNYRNVSESSGSFVPK